MAFPRTESGATAGPRGCRPSRNPGCPACRPDQEAQSPLSETFFRRPSFRGGNGSPQNPAPAGSPQFGHHRPIPVSDHCNDLRRHQSVGFTPLPHPGSPTVGARFCAAPWRGVSPSACQVSVCGTETCAAGHRTLPHSCAGWPSGAVRSMRPRTQRIQLVCRPPLPEVPVFSQGQMVREKAGRTVRLGVLPRGVYPAGRTGRTGSPKQTTDVRSMVSGYCRYLAVGGGGSAIPGSADRLFLHPAFVGTVPQFSSPFTLGRAWWWHLSGRQPLGGLPSEFLLARRGLVASFSQTLFARFGASLRGRETAFLW